MEKPIPTDTSTQTEPFPVMPVASPKKISTGRILKIIVFFVCVVGFAYQAFEFSSHFMTYPTVVDIEVETPDSFVVPAMTFCNLNPIQRSKYCVKYPDKCENPPRIREFCTLFPFYCKGNVSYLKVPKSALQSLWLSAVQRISALDTIELFQNLSDFIITTNSSDEEYIENSSWDFRRFYVGRGVESFHLCYSVNTRFESELEPTVKRFDKSVSTAVANYYIDVQPEEYFYPTEKHGIRFMAHSPFIPVNPFNQGMPMYPGFKYKIHVRLEADRLLPYPYQTSCTDYSGIWRGNGKTGARSKQMCENNCQVTFNQQCYGCHRYLAVYLEGYEICPKYVNELPCIFNKSEEYLRSQLAKCVSLCKKDCHKLKYPYTVEKISETKLELNSLILVSITVEEPEVLVLSHHPQYQNVEIFSYIGGFMGCWLGLSIWAFAGFLGETYRPIRTGINTIHHKVSSRRGEHK